MAPVGRVHPAPTEGSKDRALRVLVAGALFGWVLGAGACASPVDGTPDMDSEPSSTASSPATSGAGCTGQRWVALFKGTSGCPGGVPDGWKIQPVFTEGGAPPPRGLAGYCEAVWVGPKPWTTADATALENFFGAKNALQYEQDCVLTGPLGTPFENASREALRQALVQRVGGIPSELPPPGGAMRRKVRLAFLDSSPDADVGKIPEGRMLHGYSLAWLARNLTCPTFGSIGGTCAADLETRLVLPHVKNDVTDPIAGGFFGTREELARAIYRTVERWKKDLIANPQSSQPRLVINLSVGWEPTDNCATATDPDTMELGSKLVHLAITHASCHGALVVAAAGNAPGALANSGAGQGPVCPAAWATHAAPSKAVCQALENDDYEKPLTALFPIAQFWKLPLSTPQPLLFAAGGIDYARRPIMSTRPAGRPKLAVVSAFATSGDPAKPRPELMTGSSVSAAITSAIAATAWSYRPRLTAPELMQMVYEAGQPLPDKADFDLLPHAQIRELGLCPALAHVCEPSQGVVPEQCPASPVTCAAPGPSIETGAPVLSKLQMSQLVADFALAPNANVTTSPLP